MHAKLVALPCLCVILLGVSSQERGRAVARESSLPQQADVGSDLAVSRGSAFAAAGVQPGVRVGAALDRVGARLATAVARGSGGTGASGAQTGAALPLSVDGAKHPELIPDFVAYRHFLSVTAVSTSASKTEIDRRDSFLALVRLSPKDRAAYVAALGNVGDALTSIEHQKRLLDHANATEVANLKRQQGQLLDDTATRALRALSAEGASRLQAHINGRVKANIKIYGGVPVQ
jgi:hypothetical protein